MGKSERMSNYWTVLQVSESHFIALCCCTFDIDAARVIWEHAVTICFLISKTFYHVALNLPSIQS